MNCLFHITLVRHGETMENRQNVIQGQQDTCLSELGVQQAKLVARRLQDETFTHMYSSDLSRAAMTAKAIVEANMNSSCSLVMDKRLRERSFGVMEGQRFSDLQVMMREKNLCFKSFTPPKGESIEEVTQRASSFFNSLCSTISAELATGQPRISSSDTTPLHHANPIHAPETDQTSSLARRSTSNGNLPSQSQHNNNLSENSSIHDSHQSEKNESSPTLNILVVSHGLLLKQLKCIILERCRGKLNGDAGLMTRQVSPNTGVSKFLMRVVKEGGKTRVWCEECSLLNCKAHLCSSDQNLATEAKYEGLSNS